jgi:hypothetical protein
MGEGVPQKNRVGTDAFIRPGRAKLGWLFAGCAMHLPTSHNIQ